MNPENKELQLIHIQLSGPISTKTPSYAEESKL